MPLEASSAPLRSPVRVESCRPRTPPKHLTLMASMAYSTWNSRPSGLNVFTPRSYSDRVKNMAAWGLRLCFPLGHFRDRTGRKNDIDAQFAIQDRSRRL